MYKKGICLNAVYSDIMLSYTNLENRIKNVAESNVFDGVEFYFKGTDEEYKKIGRLIESLRLYAVFHAGYEMKNDNIDIGSIDEDQRIKAIDKTKKFIDTAYALKSKKMLILSGPRPSDDATFRKSVESIIESLNVILDYAVKNSKNYVLDIVLEFFNDNGDPYLTVGNIDTVAHICEKVVPLHNNFSITFDTSHVKQLGEDVFKSYIRLMPYIRHIHFSNCVTEDKSHPFYGDKHPLFNIEKGDFNDEDMALFMDFIDKNRGLDRIDIFSYEVICSDMKLADMYYQKIGESAGKVFGSRGYCVRSLFESEGKR